MNITEKSAYLKGLAEGLALDPQKPESKIISALIDLVEDMSAKITELERDISSLDDYVEELDEDLGYVEDFVYGDDDDAIELDEDDDLPFTCDCDDCDECEHADACFGDLDDEEEGFRCLMCPACSEKIYFDESMDPADMICPACGKAVCEDEEAGAEEV